MALPAYLLEIHSVRAGVHSGRGLLGGHVPPSPEPSSPDGRAKKLNVPARIRVCAYERSTMQCIASTRSAPDGTWEIAGLNPSLFFTVIGFDDRGIVNAAVQDWVQPHVPEP